jgi:hypothetical protein
VLPAPPPPIPDPVAFVAAPATPPMLQVRPAAPGTIATYAQTPPPRLARGSVPPAPRSVALPLPAPRDDGGFADRPRTLIEERVPGASALRQPRRR